MASQQGIRAGKAFVELYANDDKLTRGLRTAQRKLKRFSASVNQLGMKMVKFASLAAIPLALSLRIGANFEDQMSKVKAVTDGTGKSFERLNKTAKELGRTTSFTATQVAEGMVSLGRAGFSRQEIDQAIGGVLDLARATDTELAMAAEIAGSSLRQFNLSATETGRVTDVLTAAANGSAQTLEDLGEAMKYVGPIAAEAGASIEDTAAAIGILANNGIKGTMAGTAVARAYKNLASDKTAKTLQDIGVSVADANGNLRPMADILRDIGKQTDSMGNKQRLAIFEELFGRGQAAALKLASAGAKFDDMLKKIQESPGLASQTAKEMDNNLGGSFRKFMSAAGGVAIAIKEAIAEPAMKLLGYITELANSLTKFIEQNKGLVKVLVGVGIGIAAIGGILLTVGAAAGFLSFAIGGLTVAASAFGVVVGIITSPITLMVAGIVAASVAIGALISWLYKSGDTVRQIGKVILSVFGAFATYMKSGPLALAGELLWESLKVVWINGISDISKTYEKLKDAWKEVTDRFVSDWKTAIGDVNEETKKLKDGVGGKPKKAAEGTIEVFAMTQHEAKDWWAGGKKKGKNDNPIMPEFAPEPKKDPALVAANDRIKKLEMELAGISTGDPFAEMDSVRSGSGMSGTFSSMSQLIYSQDKQDKISKGDKFLGDKLDGIKNSIEEDGRLD